tara:strand:+ start:3434 stop:3688 length:255 start_codon:yes stop_codon:yes gene_type:complete
MNADIVNAAQNLSESEGLNVDPITGQQVVPTKTEMVQSTFKPGSIEAGNTIYGSSESRQASVAPAVQIDPFTGMPEVDMNTSKM